MAIYRRIYNQTKDKPILLQARWCNTFLTNLRGFTWRRHLAPTEGLVLVQKSDSRSNSTIHMLFVFFDLGVIWVNNAGIVVDKALAQSWRPYYAPSQPARYVIEGHPTLLEKVDIGDTIQFATL